MHEKTLCLATVSLNHNSRIMETIHSSKHLNQYA